MSFGGYKFAGFRVDYNSNQTLLERALLIHKARVKAFLSSSSLVNNPWILDPNRLDGTVSFESTSGVIHELTGADSNTYGYATFFKYSGLKNGYYLILTCSQCGIYNASANNYPSFSFDQFCQYKASYNSSYWGTQKGSCFQAFSSEPFGPLPQNGTYSQDFLPSESTRLVSCGRNIFSSSKSFPIVLGGSGTIVSATNISFVFGYAIKDTDIISFFSQGSSFSLSSNNCFIQLFSLNSFSEYYGYNDNNGLLYLPILGKISESESNPTEYLVSSNCPGSEGQVFNRYSLLKAMNNSVNILRIAPDLRTSFEAIGSSIIPLNGAVLVLDGTDIFENGQYAKGCTNPEFLATNFTHSRLSNSIFDTYANNLLYICSIDCTSSYHIYVFSSQNTSVSPNYVGEGYANFYIGWDLDNPDIRSSSAWPNYVG